MAEASPMRLAFAAGQVRLATRHGVTLGKWSNFPPAAPHFCFTTVSASPQVCFRSPEARALSPPILADRPHRRTRRPEDFRPRFERIASHLRLGRSPSSGEDRSPSFPFRVAMEQETLRASPAWRLSCSGLSEGAAFRPHQPGPFQVTSRPSSICEAGFPISPTPRSELHPVNANCG